MILPLLLTKELRQLTVVAHFPSNYSLSNGENNLTIKSVDKAGNEKEISLKLFFNE